MHVISLFIWVEILFSSLTSALFLSSTSSAHKCYVDINKQLKLNLTRSIGGIVGIGWNDITNEETLPVLAITYDECKTVPDGDFLIPDNVEVISIKKSHIEKSTERYDTFAKFKSSISGSIEAHASGGFAGFGVSGSMSVETKVGKEHMEQRSRTGFSNKLEYRAFQLIANENHGFDKSFANRLKEVADAIKGKNLLLAQYEAESIIGDYGTHVTNKADAGANVLWLGFAECHNETQKNAFAVSMSTSFEASYGIVSAGGKVSGGTSQSSATGSSTATSQTYIFGNGPDVNKLLNSNGTFSVDNVMGLKRSGIAIHSLIHKGVLDSHYDDKTIEIVQDLIYNATQEFYHHNTIPGCTDPTKQNYFYKANVEDGTCRDSQKLYRTVKDIELYKGGPNMQINYMGIPIAPFIGGVFQECEYLISFSKIHPKLENGNQCDKYNHPNQITKNYTCPSQFEKILAGSFYATFKDRTYSAKDGGCNSTECTKKHSITDKLKVTAYFCYQDIKKSQEKLIRDKTYDIGQAISLAKKQKASSQYVVRLLQTELEQAQNLLTRTGEGMLFGGIFENDNVFSDNRRCEVGFYEYPFFHNLKICLAPHTDFNIPKSVEFGGTISCKDIDQECPEGFSRYLATTINGCPYYYCASVAYKNSITTLPMLKKPPYIDRDLAMSKTRYSYQHEIDELEEEEGENTQSVDVR